MLVFRLVLKSHKGGPKDEPGIRKLDFYWINKGNNAAVPRLSSSLEVGAFQHNTHLPFP